MAVRSRRRDVQVICSSYRPDSVAQWVGVKVETPEQVWRDAIRKVALRVTSGEVTFATGSAQIPVGHYGDFAELAKTFNIHEELLVIEGRASAVATAFATFGIPRRRIQIVGLGETSPLFPNDTASGRLNDQRVRYRIVSDNSTRSSGFRLR